MGNIFSPMATFLAMAHEKKSHGPKNFPIAKTMEKNVAMAQIILFMH